MDLMTIITHKPFRLTLLHLLINIDSGQEDVMQKTMLLNEIKLMELKLHALKAQVESGESMVKEHSSAHLYGLLQGSDDITPDDIEAVKIKLKETA